MDKTVAGLFERWDEAESVVSELMDRGFAPDSINVIAGGEAESAAGEAGEPRGKGYGAATGAVTGGAIGGVAGLVAAAAGLTLPGIGPILVTGPIAAVLAGTGVGAVAGGLIGALTGMGVSEEEAHSYAEGLRRGGTLVTVQTDESSAQEAADILYEHGAMDMERLTDQWRKEGWTGESDAGEYAALEEEVSPVGEPEALFIYTEVTEVPLEDMLADQEAREREESDRRVERRSPYPHGMPYTGPERRRPGPSL